jgi:Domain of unknown function (DUF5916)
VWRSLAAVALLAQITIGGAGAQTTDRASRRGAPSLRATAVSAPLRLDGHLDEPQWQAADSIAELTEVEPTEGAVPVARTVVRVLATPDALMFGVMAYDPDPSGIVTFTKSRDASLGSEDHARLVLDTFGDGRTGYVFAVNPGGARYDAVVANRGESENSEWDGVWEARTARSPMGWSVEIRIPIRSLIFKEGTPGWGFNIQRRVQRLQATSRWAGPRRDYRVTQTSHAGLLVGLPAFRLGVGMSVRPSVVAGGGVPEAGADFDATATGSLDVTQRVAANLLGSLTVNTDFAETEVDTRQTNLTRFPLFFPEKRTFFLEGADVFGFGLGLESDVRPFFSRRIGLVSGQEVPLRLGAKLNGQVGNTDVGALVVRTGSESGIAPGATMGVVRFRQNVLRESSAGVIATFGDPLDRKGGWLAGADFTFQTSRFQGDKNFLIGIWGLVNGRQDLSGDRTAAGLKIDYPNDLWDIAFTYRRVGEAFDPSLGFVPRPGVHAARLGVNFQPRPGWRSVRQMFYEFQASLVTDLDGDWESYRVFMAPLNWRLESGDRFEVNVVPDGEKLAAPFEVADSVIISPGSYRNVRYRLEVQSAAKRRMSGQATWWFGGYYGGTLHQLELDLQWTPIALLTFSVNAERDIGDLPEGHFTKDLVGTRIRVNLSPDLALASFLQYDNESRSFGTNTRLRWTFHPLGDLFVVYNHNLAETLDRWDFASNQLLVKLQYTLRY